MYSAIPALPMDGGGGGGKFQGSLDGTNLPGDACLVLTSDPKPRLRWTAELHERFVDAVTQLGGADSEYTFFPFSFCFVIASLCNLVSVLMIVSLNDGLKWEEVFLYLSFRDKYLAHAGRYSYRLNSNICNGLIVSCRNDWVCY